MKKGFIVIAAVLAMACLWRAPGFPVHPSGMVYMPDIRFMFQNAFAWGAITVFSYYLATQINLWVGLFVVLASFSAYYPINTSTAERTHQLIIYGVIWYTVCVHFLNTKKAVNWILNAICIIALVNCAFLIMQGYFDYDPMHQGVPPLWGGVIDKTPNVGLMSCYNGASAMLAFCFPAFLRKRWWIGLFPLALGLIFAHTFGGPLAIACALTLWVFVRFRERVYKLLFVLIVIISLFGYTKYVDKPDHSWRLKAWKFAYFKVYPQHPLFGYGLGHWKLVFKRKDVAIQTSNSTSRQWHAQAHNEPIQGLVEMGILFAVVLLGYLGSVVIRAVRYLTVKCNHILMISLMSLVAIIVVSTVFFPFHIALLAMIALTLMAILENSLRGRYA